MKLDGRNKAAAVKRKVELLLRKLHETQQELRVLAGGPHRASDGEGEDQTPEGKEFRQHRALMNAVPVRAALLDPNGVILLINDAWQRFVGTAETAGKDPDVGENYLVFCESAQGSCAPIGMRAAAGIRAVLGGEAPQCVIEYPHHTDSEKHWFRLVVTPISEDGVRHALVMHFDITDREQAGVSVRETEDRLRTFIDHSPAVIFQKDGKGRYVQVNRQFQERFQLSPEQVIGKTDHEIFPPEQAAEFVANDREVLRAGRPMEFEERAEYRDGIHVSIVSKFPLRDTDGNIIGICGIATDITERKRIEEALRASRANMAAAQHVAHFGSWELDMAQPKEISKNALRWSDEMYRIAGLEPGEVEVTNELFFSLVHPDDREAIERAVKAAIEQRSQYSIVHRLIRPNGDVRVVQESAQLFTDESTGRLLKLVGTTHDITDRKQAERSIQESEERFRLLSNATHDAIWDWNLGMNEVWWNEGFENLFGFVRREVHNGIDSWVSRIHPDDRERVLTEVDRVMETGSSSWSGEYRFQRNDGSYAYVLDRGHVIRDGDGKPVRLIGGMTDNTTRKRAEVELARSNRSLQMLSACNESLIRATDEAQLLDDICRVAVTIGGYCMAWVGYARRDDSCGITPMASAGEGREYLSEIKLSWADNEPIGKGPAGQTIRSGKPTLSRCISEDSESFYWQDAARKHGFQSVICLPLRDGDQTFGLLGLYSRETSEGSAQELKLLQELADNLAFGIRNLRTQVERQRTQEVVLKVAQSVSTSGSEEFFKVLTRNMVEALDAASGAIGRINRQNRNCVDTLSFIHKGEALENICYDVGGTPCEGVTRGEACVFESRLQQRFPTDAMLGDFGLESYAGIPLLSSQGEVVGLMAVMFQEPMEHTELVLSTLRIFAARAAAEIGRQEVDARNREQASLLDKARDAILVRDLQNRITYWNKSAQRLYGWTGDEALGRPVNRLLYRDDSSFQQATSRVLEAGEWTGELEQVDKQGRELTIEGRWTLVHDAKGQPKSILAINTDITERKKLEVQFLRTQRMESIGTLAGGIAHDLNNVLAPILMSVQMLRGYVSEQSGKEMLDVLESSAQRAADLVKQVLSFARGVEGRRVLINSYHVVRDIEKIIRDTFPKNIQATIEKSGDLWMVQGDPTQLHQVLVNLCVNARDAMPNGGKLTISLKNLVLDEVYANLIPDSKPGSHVMIAVSDTGSGMPAEILDKIFEPFFTTKDIGHGTGLGLSTTLAIVKSHGGFINVYSEPGKGSTFKVYLPASMESAPPECAPTQSPAVPRGNGETVLVVDDEEYVRSIAQRTLERFGYRVLLANNGAEAVALYAKRGAEIAIVVTDMAMPVMDGPATIIALRAMKPDIRIIGSSGLASNKSVAKAVGAELEYFVPKPYTAETLLQTIHEALTQ